MDHPEGAGLQRAYRVDFDPRVRLEFRGTQLSSDGGLLVMRELDDALGLSDLASAVLCDNRRGKNTVHRLDGLFRQSVYGRLAGYEFQSDRLGYCPNAQKLRSVGRLRVLSWPRSRFPLYVEARRRPGCPGLSRSCWRRCKSLRCAPSFEIPLLAIHLRERLTNVFGCAEVVRVNKMTTTDNAIAQKGRIKNLCS